ncbi:MAG: AAA family ATPase [Holophagales bacterium]|nr:AAA family ATPase [Holophagales bacterium]
MIRFTSLTVENFRSIRRLTVDVPNLAVLIGRNNAGKSNILQALRFLLDGATKDLSEEDFYCGRAGRSERLHVEATVSGMDEDALGLLEEKHRGKISACVAAGQIRIRKPAGLRIAKSGRLRSGTRRRARGARPSA